jgi:hypothetical protein
MVHSRAVDKDQQHDDLDEHRVDHVLKRRGDVSNRRTGFTDHVAKEPVREKGLAQGAAAEHMKALPEDDSNLPGGHSLTMNVSLCLWIESPISG